MSKLIAAIAAKWNSLPSWAKTTVKTSAVLFGGAATGVIRHALQNPNACLSEHCLVGYVVSAVHAGGIAVGAYLMKSPLRQEVEEDLTQAQAPAQK
jgi:hypothetical protein